ELIHERCAECITSADGIFNNDRYTRDMVQLVGMKDVTSRIGGGDDHNVNVGILLHQETTDDLIRITVLLQQRSNHSYLVCIHFDDSAPRQRTPQYGCRIDPLSDVHIVKDIPELAPLQYRVQGKRRFQRALCERTKV